MNNQLFNYAPPDFDNPNIVIIDSFRAPGNMRDRIRLVSRSAKFGISFKVYVHDPNRFGWVEYGIGFLKGAGDTDYINSPLEDTLANYRYFAVEAMDGNTYQYTPAKKSHDLYITVSD